LEIFLNFKYNFMKNGNVIMDLTLNFSLAIIKYAEKLEENLKYVIARQLIKSGTSIGANVFEAQLAESRADFIHKLKIADKEAHETEYWLTLCSLSDNYPSNLELKPHSISIKKVLSKIISSSKRKANS